MIYYVNIDVRFKKKLVLKFKDYSDQKMIKGYLQEIGCTAPSEDEMKKMIKALVLQTELESNATIRYERIGIIRDNDIQKEIYEDCDIASSLIGDPIKTGIWYKTGRGYYY
jgi:hypothetical protein